MKQVENHLFNSMSYISADSKKSIFIPYITEYENIAILASINDSSPCCNKILSVILKAKINYYIRNKLRPDQLLKITLEISRLKVKKLDKIGKFSKLYGHCCWR